MEVPADHLPADALTPVLPEYGSGSLADLLPSVCAVLGVPGAVDVLGLAGPLDGVDRVAVLLVDGLGAYQVPVASAYAPILKDLAAGSRSLTAGFPSTTPVSLVTVGTGAVPGAHGVLGFTTRRPDGRVLNHIRWTDDPDPRAWQPVATRFELAAAAGLAVTVVNKPEYAGSGLSVSATRGAEYVGAADPASLAAGMLAALGAGPGIVYGYHPDLDHYGHADGVDSPRWRSAAADVDALLDRLLHGLPARSALLVIADHGQLNVPAPGRYDLADNSDLSAGIVGVAGEPRVRYLYTAPGARADVIAAWQGVFGSSAWVLAREEAIGRGLFGEVAPEHADRIGEVVVICLERVVALATGWEPPTVGKLIAYHGSVTAAEMMVPLLISR
ncbi:alkaline phosphatase family protein [Actinoplanes sp. KI2]|uniref:alkaline phosphatase family protein n=1 Tax=Actinoplanes sp. KI2 TaxID=2983315 RepID=UPI0021D60702|nr:alkaline phosphatase family protein [Actinoplanes sp. KI2]MCU7723572.1 alkaline phosphatase family protein [Actinoplanes sp. KI2]